jgi:hypothetical protein
MCREIGPAETQRTLADRRATNGIHKIVKGVNDARKRGASREGPPRVCDSTYLARAAEGKNRSSNLSKAGSFRGYSGSP